MAQGIKQGVFGGNPNTSGMMMGMQLLFEYLQNVFSQYNQNQ